MIPALVDGVLPDGIHLCTVAEIDATFGRFQRSDQRIRLTMKLRELEEQARKSGIVAALIIDGSYITAKEEPSDVDLIIALRKDFDLTAELRPFEYNIRSRRMIRQQYRFDVRVVVDGSELYDAAVAWFSQVKVEQQERYGFPLTKGLLRIEL